MRLWGLTTALPSAALVIKPAAYQQNLCKVGLDASKRLTAYCRYVAAKQALRMPRGPPPPQQHQLSSELADTQPSSFSPRCMTNCQQVTGSKTL